MTMADASACFDGSTANFPARVRSLVRDNNVSGKHPGLLTNSALLSGIYSDRDEQKEVEAYTYFQVNRGCTGQQISSR
jgi:hypothetical protein